MSNDENEQQHINRSRLHIHLRLQPNKKGCQVGGYRNRLNNRIGVVGTSPTDIPRCRMGHFIGDGISDNILVIDKLLKT